MDEMLKYVTPFRGVWIEIIRVKMNKLGKRVTPFRGVWIEIVKQEVIDKIMICHTLQGCVD